MLELFWSLDLIRIIRRSSDDPRCSFSAERKTPQSKHIFTFSINLVSPPKVTQDFTLIFQFCLHQIWLTFLNPLKVYFGILGTGCVKMTVGEIKDLLRDLAKENEWVNMKNKTKRRMRSDELRPRSCKYPSALPCAPSTPFRWGCRCTSWWFEP